MSDSADHAFMAEALLEARRSLEVDEFPVGAVVVLGAEVVARAHWRGVRDGRLLDHAELLALLQAERSGKIARRHERHAATLYTTLEPCHLCMAAAMCFYLGRIVYALEAPVDGGTNLPELWRPPDGHPQPGELPYGIPQVDGGVGRAASAALLSDWIGGDPNRAWAASYLAQDARA